MMDQDVVESIAANIGNLLKECSGLLIFLKFLSLFEMGLVVVQSPRFGLSRVQA